ncbi:hypothetical protein VTK56DRAFT_9989 [Thermocarpiscus australiensis]
MRHPQAFYYCVLRYATRLVGTRDRSKATGSMFAREKKKKQCEMWYVLDQLFATGSYEASHCDLSSWKLSDAQGLWLSRSISRDRPAQRQVQRSEVRTPQGTCSCRGDNHFVLREFELRKIPARRIAHTNLPCGFTPTADTPAHLEFLQKHVLLWRLFSAFLCQSWTVSFSRYLFPPHLFGDGFWKSKRAIPKGSQSSGFSRRFPRGVLWLPDSAHTPVKHVLLAMGSVKLSA